MSGKPQGLLERLAYTNRALYEEADQHRAGGCALQVEVPVTMHNLHLFTAGEVRYHSL